MKKVVSLVICLCGSFFYGGISRADESVKWGVTADYFSKYIWRGQCINDESVLQPSAFMSLYGFTGSVWTNLDLTGENNSSGEFTEVDLTLDYTKALPCVEGINFSVGTIHYRFPNTPYEPTTELYGGLSAALPLSPTIKIYRDVDEIEGFYIQFAAGHTIEKIAVWKEDCYCDVQLGASMGYGTSSYNDGYFGVESGEFNDLTISAGLPIWFGRLVIKPSVCYSTMLSDNIRDATDNSENLWGGVSTSIRF